MSDSDDIHGNKLSTATGSWSQTSDPRVLWEALIHDAEVGVIILDALGTIRFGNTTAQEAMGADQTDLSGKSWCDLLPKDVADERLRCAERVARTSQPIALIGMIKGVCRCAIFRPLQTDPDDHAHTGDMSAPDRDGSGAGIR